MTPDSYWRDLWVQRALGFAETDPLLIELADGVARAKSAELYAKAAMADDQLERIPSNG